MITKLTTVACIAAATVLTVVASASSGGSRQANHADARNRGATPANHPTHFVFVGFPAVGAKAGTPTAGRLVISLEFNATAYRSTGWSVYADGRIIWQTWAGVATVVPAGAKRLDTAYVQQRLTRQGVQLLQSKILATGLFDHDLKLTLPGHQVWVSDRVRTGGRIVTVQGVSGSGQTSPTPTPAQASALAWIATLVADPARWLPASAWADRQIRAFVPACYQIAFDDRPYPDLAKLPPPAGKALAQYKQLRRNGGQSVRTRQARALLQALAKAGITPDENNAREIYFHLGQLPGQPHPAGLWLSPALPNECF